MGRKRTESKVRLVQSQTDVLVPRSVKNYLERILEPEEEVVFFERPRRRQVAQRNQLFVVLTLSALVFLPAVSILFGTISFFTIIPQSEGFFMVGLFLFDLLLVAIWTGYYHTLTEAYVVTTKRLLVVRPDGFGKNLTHREAYIDKEMEGGIKILCFDDHSASLHAKRVTFSWITNQIALFKALETVSRQNDAMLMHRHKGKLWVIQIWTVRAAVGLLLCLFFSLGLPFIAQEASSYRFDFDENSAAPEPHDSSDTETEFITFWVTVALCFALCFVFLSFFIIRSTKGLFTQAEMRFSSARDLNSPSGSWSTHLDHGFHPAWGLSEYDDDQEPLFSEDTLITN